MTRGQKAGYILSEWTVGFLILFGMFVLTFSIFEDKQFALRGSVGLFLLMFGPVAVKKWWAIRKSKARLNEAEPG
jgi:hypothetical protein